MEGGWEVCMYHMGWKLSIDTCFRESIGLTMFVFVEFFTPSGMDYAHIMLTLEEQFMMYWLVEHLAYDEDFILDDTINGGG